MFRIAVFTSAPVSHLVRSTLVELLARHPDLTILVLEHAPRRPAKSLVKSQIRNLRTHGPRWLPYLARHTFQTTIAPRLKKRPSAHLRVPMAWPRAVGDVLDDPRVRIERHASINAADVVETLTAWSPDVGLSIGGPILRAPLFSTPRLGTVNLHQGKLPDYRGMPPAFWELWNDETSVGVSVHKVEAGLDTGDVLLAGTVPIERHSTPAGLRVRLDAVGRNLIVEAISRIKAGTAQFSPQADGGQTYRRPTLKQERDLERRIAGRKPAAAYAKRALFAGFNTVQSARGSSSNRVCVLLYHRVSDAYRDNVTCGVATFDDHMRYLADHHRVVALSDLLGATMPAGDGPVVAVTFDDGYRDNYENAAEILLKHDVPATFFVSTHIVDEKRAFPHDMEALKHSVPTMTWDEMRQMQDAGLSFGGHTANHVNMALASDALAEEELTQSRDMLRDRLGLDEIMFAYPYGGRGNFTPRRLAQVQAAGYVCNCSAYGGYNPLTVDRWNIKRIGIDYRFDVPALRSRLYGWEESPFARP